MDESAENSLNRAGAGSRCLWPPGVGDNDLLAATVQDRPFLWLHDDVCTDELRRAARRYHRVVQAVGPLAGERIGGSLDGEDRAGIIQGEGKGDTRTEARRRSRSVRFPSLPAGINTDDSDPLGPDSGMFQRTAIGAGRNPPFWGGRYRLPGFFCIVIMEAE